VPDVPLSPAEIDAERKAYAELLAFIGEHKDPGTTFTHLTPEEFNLLLVDFS
jgi:hypothetical protein